MVIEKIIEKAESAICQIDNTYDEISPLMYNVKDENFDRMDEGIKCLEQAKKQLLDLLNLLKYDITKF